MKIFNLRAVVNALPIQLVLFLALAILLWSDGSRAQGDEERDPAVELGPIMNRHRVPAPPMSGEELARLDNARRYVLREDRDVDCTDPNAPVAFTVTGWSYRSAGPDQILYYSPPTLPSGVLITNEGDGWQQPDMFIAPCDGLYFFTISFVKDSFYYGGTQDDVTVSLRKTNYPDNSIETIPGSAWSGEAAGRRGTGAYSVAIRLDAGDAIRSWVHSDGDPMRHLGQFSLTGFRIAP